LTSYHRLITGHPAGYEVVYEKPYYNQPEIARGIKIILFYIPKKFSNNIIVKYKGGFTASTDFSIGEKEFKTTSSIHKNAPRLSVWLWAQIGVFLLILNEVFST
jgi:hypothetical protein